MQNLLTSEQKEILRKGYRKRLIVVTALMFAVAALVSVAVFVPVYIVASFKQKEIEDRNKINTQIFVNRDHILSLPKNLNQKAALVVSHKDKTPVFQRLQGIILKNSGEIDLQDISFSKDIIVVSGIAPDRESLISFQNKIENEEGVDKAEIPVGNFVPVKNLKFSMTVTLSSE